MHPAEINAEIRKAGATQTAIAETLGVSPATVSAVINGRIKSKRVASAIALVVSRSVVSLWPEKDSRTKKQRELASAKAAIGSQKFKRAT